MGKQNFLTAAAGTLAVAILYRIRRRMREASYSFNGRVVVITGGSRGLGLVLARQLACQGAQLAILARDEKELAVAFEELDRLHAEVKIYPCDIRKENDLQKTIQQIIQDFGRLDVLINNAGQIIVSPFKSNSPTDFQDLMDLHFSAPLQAIYAVLPHMRKQQAGRIVNISSIAGRLSVPHLLPYSASKHALSGLSDGLSMALAQENIYVTTVCPGLMRTGSPRNADIKGLHEREYRWFKIGDSLPLLTTGAEHAARNILRACRRKSPAITIGLPAYLLQLLHALSPAVYIRGMRLVNHYVLPKAINRKQVRKGYQTRYEKNHSPLTQLTDQAAEENNEILPTTAP